MLSFDVFVRYYLELPVAMQAAEDALLESPEKWIPGLVERAEKHGRALLGEVGFRAAGGRVQKRVVIEFRDAIRFPSRTVLPMTWRAASRQALFPKLDADLELAQLGPSLTQFSISARYTPPLGAVGKAIDGALLHRVAEATIKDFVDGAGKKLEALVARGGGTSHAVRP
jgi:hypothetical protein